MRVTTVAGLTAALLDEGVFFAECAGLPGHTANVDLHKGLSAQLVRAVDGALVGEAEGRLQWTLRRAGGGAGGGTGTRVGAGDRVETGVETGVEKGIGTEAGTGTGARIGEGNSAWGGRGPLVVLLSGWMGGETDFPSQLLHLPADTLTVSTHDILSPSLYCRSLHNIITHLRPGSAGVAGVVLVGYSQGGRLAMHYRSLHPAQVARLVCFAAAPGKAAYRCGTV